MHNTMAAKGYVVYDQNDEASEGLGSHSRGILFPLLHIAIVNGLQPLLEHKTYCCDGRNYSRLDLNNAFLGGSIDDVPAPRTVPHLQEYRIDVWADPVLGSACGDAKLLANLIRDYLSNKTPVRQQKAMIVLRLTGHFRYMDPSPVVYRWLQDRSLLWKQAQSNAHSSRLRIAGHIRVPEEFCPLFWKEENNVDKIIEALDFLQSNGLNLDDSCDIEVFTETTFSTTTELLLHERYKQITIFRGTDETVLHDLQSLATADIMIPAASFLSALAGYLSHGLIILPHRSRDRYFEAHCKLGSQIVKTWEWDEDYRRKLTYSSERILATSEDPSQVSISRIRSAVHGATTSSDHLHKAFATKPKDPSD